MGNRRNRRSRRLETPSPERSIERTQVETPNTGNITLTNPDTVVQENLGENNIGEQLVEPNQISTEIQAWTQIFEQKNNDRIEKMREEMDNKLETILREIKSNKSASITTNPRSEINENRNQQPTGSKTDRSIGVHASNIGDSDSENDDYPLRASKMKDLRHPAKPLFRAESDVDVTIHSDEESDAEPMEDYHMVTGANRQLHRQSSQNPLNDTTGSHANQNASNSTTTPIDPVNQIALAIEKLANKNTQPSLFHPKNTLTFNGKNEKNEKFEYFEDLFHTTLKMQPNLTEEMKINHFHAHLRGLALKTFKNIQRTPTTTLEDILKVFRRKYVKPESSGGYDHIITAIDVFSRYLFAYPVTRITATAVSRVIMDILCKHTYLPTTIITDLGSQFNAQVTHEVAAVLGIELKHATMKHAQTIGLLERTHASVKTHLKAATGEFRNNWHKYLPLAVLNHNTTYHASLGCEPSRVFHGRIPHNILDYKLGYNPNPRYQPQADVAEEIQKRMKILLDQTKKNIMQSYLKYKAYYDRKAKAAPLETTDYCYILNPKADTQATKIPFREFRWCGPYKVEKVLPNNNYIVRRLGTNKTQLLHRIRLRKFTPQAPLADIFVRETDWQKDDQMLIANDDLYAQSWNTNFGSNPFEDGPSEYSEDTEETEYTPIQTPNDNRPPSPGSSKNSGGSPVEQTTEPDQSCDNYENDIPQQSNDDDNNTQKTQKDTNISTDDNTQKTPENSQNTPLQEEPINTRGEKYNLRPNPNPNYSDTYRY